MIRKTCGANTSTGPEDRPAKCVKGLLIHSARHAWSRCASPPACTRRFYGQKIECDLTGECDLVECNLTVECNPTGEATCRLIVGPED